MKNSLSRGWPLMALPALAGGAIALICAGEAGRVAERANALPVNSAEAPLPDPAPYCHAGPAAAAARLRTRLAATRTEVPQSEMSAASSAAEFADSDPPL